MQIEHAIFVFAHVGDNLDGSEFCGDAR
jgi:hypothetical protein